MGEDPNALARKSIASIMANAIQLWQMLCYYSKCHKTIANAIERMANAKNL